MSIKYKKLNLRSYEVHALIYDLIKPGSFIFDIGSATGYFGEFLKKKNCKVWGLEIDKESAIDSRKRIDKVFIGDINLIEEFSLNHNSFDCVLLMDVIEHITTASEVLSKLKKYITSEGRIIISTPNIAHISIRLKLLFGQFIYTRIGIMDESHIHFYTKETLKGLVRKSGYKIDEIDYSSDFGQLPIFGKVLRHIPKILQHSITKLFNTLLAVQYVIVISKK